MKKITALMLSVSMLSAYATSVFAADVTYKAYTEDEVVSTNKNADLDYVFDMNGEKFTLLDTFDNSSSKYLVIANQNYDKNYIEIDSFTSDESTSLKNWLNTDFISKSYSGSNLNDDIISHLDKNHVWGLDPSDNIAENTTFTGGVSIPSVSEMTAYANIMGYADPGESYPTRTQITGVAKCIAIYDASKSNVDNTSWKLVGRKSGFLGVRPIFYLDDKFFAETKLDLTKAGDKVKEEIRKIDVSELLNLYETDYLVENLGITPPSGYISIKNLTIKTLSTESVKNGETLLASFDYDSANENDMKSASYVWERVTDEGNAEEIGEDDKYIVTEADTIGGKYSIRFKVTVTDTEGNSTVKYSSLTSKVPAIVTKSYLPNLTIPMQKNVENTDYKFKVGDKSFTLVDSFNNDKSTFFVVPNDSYGKAGMAHPYFDPQDKTSMAYTMNTTFVNEGLGSLTLPDEVVEYIDYDHMWACEAAPLSLNEQVHESYAFKAGVTLLSFTEIEKYKNILATVDNLGGYSRTPAEYINTDKDKAYIQNIKWNDQQTGVWTNVWDTIGAKNEVLPVFYIGKDFFKEVKLDLDTVGDKALEMLINVYTVEDLKSLYGVSDLEAKGFKHNYGLSASFSGNAGGDAVLSGNITSNVMGEHSKVLILCVYDENGIAVATKAQKINFNGKETKTVSLSAGALPAGTYTAKAMLWDNLYDANAEMASALY